MSKLNPASRRTQWVQLIVLTVAHGLADLYAGIIAPLLPAVRAHAHLSLTRGVALITTVNITCNAVQLVVGSWRGHRDRPLLMPIGLVLAATMALVGLVPDGPLQFPLLLAVCVVASIGVACVHPEGLRATGRLDTISPAVCNAVFLFGGFGGFVAGSWGCTYLVHRWGLSSLLILPLLTAAATGALLAARVRLATDDGSPARADAAGRAELGFWSIFAMTVPAAIGTTILIALLPTRLAELGFELPFGGRTVMTLGLGGAVGSMFWAHAAKRRSELGCAAVSLLSGAPFILLYLALLEHAAAVWVLVPAGFCCVGAYPLSITLAQRAAGPSLGRRMAFICGGTSLLAGLVLQATGPIAQAYGTGLVLHVGWLGYAAAGLLAVLLYRRSAERNL